MRKEFRFELLLGVHSGVTFSLAQYPTDPHVQM